MKIQNFFYGYVVPTKWDNFLKFGGREAKEFSRILKKKVPETKTYT